MAWLALTSSPKAALQGLYWSAIGKRVRGWNRLCAAAARHSRYYREWISLAEAPWIAGYCGENHAPAQRFQCLILNEPSANHAMLLKSADSVRRSFGEDVTIWVSHPQISGTLVLEHGRSLRSAVLAMRAEAPSAKWLLPIHAGDEIAPRTRDILNQAISRNDAPDILYWDEDTIRSGHRASPWIKPCWDPLLFKAEDFLTGTSIVQLDRLIEAAETLPSLRPDSGGFGAALTSMVEALGRPAPIHLPFIVTHRSSGTGRSWRVVTPAAPKSWPSVSIIIPTRDGHELLEKCVTSLARLSYPGPVEILVIDNGSVAPETQALFDHFRDRGIAKVISMNGPFNFSLLNNRAAKLASGTVLCLLNNDVEALDDGWLTAMVRYAVLEDVGAVGAQLLYPDGSIQHAGVVVGIGNAAGHFGKGLKPDSKEHPAWTNVGRQVSAVTAACLVVRSDRYFEVGGLDEDRFTVAFNDVDFCLKLDRAGYRNIYVAQARLTHHELKSRGIDDTPEKAARFMRETAALHKEWNTAGYHDPKFSPLFSHTSEQYLLEFQLGDAICDG